MAKESLYSVDKNITFKETFLSDYYVFSNHGVSSNVQFENGEGIFDETQSSKIDYPIGRHVNFTITARVTFLTLVTGVNLDYAFHLHDNSGTRFGISFSSGYESDRLLFMYDGNTQIKSSIQIELNKEYTVTITRNNGTIRGYIDGMYFGQITSSNNKITHLRINGRADSEAYYSTMKMDKFEIYNNTTLNDEEINLLWGKRMYVEPESRVEGIPSLYSNAQATVKIDSTPEYYVNNFEIETIIQFKIGNRQDIISCYNNTPDNRGFIFRIESDGNTILNIYGDGSYVISYGTLNGNTIYRLGAKYSIDGSFSEGYLNGISLGKKTINLPIYYIIWDTTMDFYLGMTSHNGNNKYSGNIFRFKYYQLDPQGNRIKELINLDFNKSTGTVVPNIAQDAPLNSNGTVIPNGQTTDSWWQKFGELEEVFSLDLTTSTSIIDLFGSNIINTNTIIKKIGESNAAYFNGIDAYLQSDSTESIQMVSVWINPLENNKSFLKLNSSIYLSTNSSNQVILNGTTGTIYVNNIQTNQLILNKWQLIGVVLDNSIILDTPEIGRNSTSYLNCLISIVKMISGSPSDPAKFTAQYYNSTKSQFGL